MMHFKILFIDEDVNDKDVISLLIASLENVKLHEMWFHILGILGKE